MSFDLPRATEIRSDSLDAYYAGVFIRRRMNQVGSVSTVVVERDSTLIFWILKRKSLLAINGFFLLLYILSLKHFPIPTYLVKYEINCSMLFSILLIVGISL